MAKYDWDYMKLLARLFLLFTLVTIVELYLLLKLAEVTNWWVTVAMVVVPGLVGAWLAKREGIKAFRGIREAASLTREPTGAILDGVIVLLAATLMITPGVLTDLTGLALLLPPVRRRVAVVVRTRFRRWLDRHVASGPVNVDLGRFGGGGTYEVIDAEDIPRPR